MIVGVDKGETLCLSAAEEVLVGKENASGPCRGEGDGPGVAVVGLASI